MHWILALIIGFIASSLATVAVQRWWPYLRIGSLLRLRRLANAPLEHVWIGSAEEIELLETHGMFGGFVRPQTTTSGHATTFRVVFRILDGPARVRGTVRYLPQEVDARSHVVEFEGMHTSSGELLFMHMTGETKEHPAVGVLVHGGLTDSLRGWTISRRAHGSGLVLTEVILTRATREPE